MLHKRVGCVVVGLGPAGAGFLFHAFRSGAMGRLVDDGLILIDTAERMGTGRLGEYQVSANSVNDVFLNCLADPAFGDVFAALHKLPAYQRMCSDRQGVVMLPEVAKVLGAATELLVAHIENQYGCLLRRRHQVERVNLLKDGYELVVQSDDERPYRLRTTSLVMNVGGCQPTRLLQRALTGMGLGTAPAQVACWNSEDVLSIPTPELRANFVVASRAAASHMVAVVGSSHSAFSCVERLACELESVGLKKILVLHRSPIKLFFETAELAAQAGYQYDESRDVCPVSGRVNRSGGLRYRALEVGAGVLRDGVVPDTRVRVRLQRVGGGDAAAAAEARRWLDRCAAVTQAIGYLPRLPKLCDVDGQPIALREVQGGLDSDACGCPRDELGRRLRGLYMFGLGSGLAVDPAIGSEASFEGRIYGVWQFHHDASGPALEQVLDRNRKRLLRRREGEAESGQPLSAAITSHESMFWPANIR